MGAYSPRVIPEAVEDPQVENGGQGRNRTSDTRIFGFDGEVGSARASRRAGFATLDCSILALVSPAPVSLSGKSVAGLDWK